ncbi:MAG: hypothetical protein JWR02_1321 [Mucilaginibacter sp.]|nr:hypothetical protein [Mucilaginibacter sp.]
MIFGLRDYLLRVFVNICGGFKLLKRLGEV